MEGFTLLYVDVRQTLNPGNSFTIYDRYSIESCRFYVWLILWKLGWGMEAYHKIVGHLTHIIATLSLLLSVCYLGRCQACHVHILQIGLHVAIAQTDARPAMPTSLR